MTVATASARKINMKQRLDVELAKRGLVASRSQAESFIKLGQVRVNGKILTKPGEMVSDEAEIKLLAIEQYVSRAGLKLASVAKALKLNFKHKIVLDVGSSTGGFTDYALKNGATKVIAVDVGTNQLHPSLRNNPKIELHEQTDIRTVGLKTEDWRLKNPQSSVFNLPSAPDLVVIDVSFISLRDVLPHVSTLMDSNSELVAMCKPQFEAGSSAKHKGVIKNDKMRRDILKDFEAWLKNHFVTIDKADSNISGAKGNTERFYLLKKLS
jgi:23S rRNA (cytidine1920-2'-O)/16S rRNA (cytidine1409-2'-O)-methyltransferase